MKWSPNSICDLYQSRWGVEVFFKQIKQTLQLTDFIGHSENAVRWQVWSTLLAIVLLRFIAFHNTWEKPFTRLVTLLRSVLFAKLELSSVLKSCGTAHGRNRHYYPRCKN